MIWMASSSEAKKAYARAYYRRNRGLYKDHAAKTEARNQEYLRAYLRKHPCVDCGQDDIRVLDFDHVRGKKLKAVTRMARSGVGLRKLQEEIDKCEIRCANCHRIKTWHSGPKLG
jgi:hypothetical protein